MIRGLPALALIAGTLPVSAQQPIARIRLEPESLVTVGQPVTVIVPTRLAALQLRRRLAQLGRAYAGVRFETASRVAELVAGADLARAGRRPLARPIADYVATQVALESRGPLTSVAVRAKGPSGSLSLARTLACPESSTVWVPDRATVRLSGLAAGIRLAYFDKRV